ncbi:hypothetical protein IEN85_17970 [Pelagicoccus sp. NFK12]|uniref:Uncharacterized protein n=1 Tax=Pelagicoccus enzymogenes TaxID=2773457 RepID=A0A927IJ32_9BACT|nr:hypothetical protein [Pelagicoccus enzymogenes]MBD5781393.1 hypothetical protein [Pelagicoccus enzymogenes]
MPPDNWKDSEPWTSLYRKDHSAKERHFATTQDGQTAPLPEILDANSAPFLSIQNPTPLPEQFTALAEDSATPIYTDFFLEEWGDPIDPPLVGKIAKRGICIATSDNRKAGSTPSSALCVIDSKLSKNATNVVETIISSVFVIQLPDGEHRIITAENIGPSTTLPIPPDGIVLGISNDTSFLVSLAAKAHLNNCSFACWTQNTISHLRIRQLGWLQIPYPFPPPKEVKIRQLSLCLRQIFGPLPSKPASANLEARNLLYRSFLGYPWHGPQQTGFAQSSALAGLCASASRSPLAYRLLLGNEPPVSAAWYLAAQKGELTKDEPIPHPPVQKKGHHVLANTILAAASLNEETTARRLAEHLKYLGQSKRLEISPLSNAIAQYPSIPTNLAFNSLDNIEPLSASIFQLSNMAATIEGVELPADAQRQIAASRALTAGDWEKAATQCSTETEVGQVLKAALFPESINAPLNKQAPRTALLNATKAFLESTSAQFPNLLATYAQFLACFPDAEEYAIPPLPKTLAEGDTITLVAHLTLSGRYSEAAPFARTLIEKQNRNQAHPPFVFELTYGDPISFANSLLTYAASESFVTSSQLPAPGSLFDLWYISASLDYENANRILGNILLAMNLQFHPLVAARSNIPKISLPENLNTKIRDIFASIDPALL